MLALDLDRFKEVNDTYGHAAGDAVLAEFARRMRGEIREVDLAFRQGGEEFVVLLPETDGPAARVVAERLGAAIRRTAGDRGARPRGDEPPKRVLGHRLDRHRRLPGPRPTGQGVLEAADDALYAAKAAGRDTYGGVRGRVRRFAADPPRTSRRRRRPVRRRVPGHSPPRQSRGR